MTAPKERANRVRNLLKQIEIDVTKLANDGYQVKLDVNKFTFEAHKEVVQRL